MRIDRRLPLIHHEQCGRVSRSAERKSNMTSNLRSTLFAASVAGIAAVALTAPAFADEVTTESTTTEQEAVAPPPPAEQSTTTTTTRTYSDPAPVVVAEPPPPPPPAPGVTVGIPGVVGVHVGP
jgi:hypothetical protein